MALGKHAPFARASLKITVLKLLENSVVTHKKSMFAELGSDIHKPPRKKFRRYLKMISKKFGGLETKIADSNFF